MKLSWEPGKKWSLEYLGNKIAVASQVVTDEPLLLKNSIKIPARSFVMAPAYCSQMFTGRVMATPCDELKNKFPNIYMEPIQFDNNEGKSHDTIPYMINLDYEDQVYIDKKTPLAYITNEDISCEYLEVNEIIDSTKGINWVAPQDRKIVTSD